MDNGRRQVSDTMRILRRWPRCLVVPAVLWGVSSGYTSGCGNPSEPYPISIETNPRVITLALASSDAPAVRDVELTPASVAEMSASIGYDGPAATEWLGAEVLTSEDSALLRLSISPEGLEAGEYHATITITSSDPEVLPGSADILLTVTP
jgi:hypothetical protein